MRTFKTSNGFLYEWKPISEDKYKKMKKSQKKTDAVKARKVGNAFYSVRFFGKSKPPAKDMVKTIKQTIHGLLNGPLPENLYMNFYSSVTGMKCNFVVSKIFGDTIHVKYSCGDDVFQMNAMYDDDTPLLHDKVLALVVSFFENTSKKVHPKYAIKTSKNVIIKVDKNKSYSVTWPITNITSSKVTKKLNFFANGGSVFSSVRVTLSRKNRNERIYNQYSRKIAEIVKLI